MKKLFSLFASLLAAAPLVALSACATEVDVFRGASGSLVETCEPAFNEDLGWHEVCRPDPARCTSSWNEEQGWHWQCDDATAGSQPEPEVEDPPLTTPATSTTVAAGCGLRTREWFDGSAGAACSNVIDVRRCTEIGEMCCRSGGRCLYRPHSAWY